MRPNRDQEVSEALRRLGDAPEPTPGFEDRVWAAIAADDEAHASGGAARTAGRAPRRSRPRRASALAAAGLAAAVIAAAAVLFGLPGAGDETGPPPVSAAEVSAKMRAAASGFRTLHGTMRWTLTGGEWDRAGGTLWLDADGSFSLRFDEDAWTRAAVASTTGSSQEDSASVSPPVSMTYDARRHARLDTYRWPEGGLYAYRWADSLPYEGIGVPAWNYPYPPGYAWLVRAALADGDPAITIRTTVFDGRPAWAAMLPEGERFGYLAGARFVIDQETGFLVSWTDPDDAAWLRSSTLTDLRVDEPLPRGIFSTRPSHGVETSVDASDYFCEVGEVADRVGFAPLAPAKSPEGYALRDAATDQRGPASLLGWQGPDPDLVDDDEPHRQAFLRYRDGYDAFTVQTVSLDDSPRAEIPGYFAGVDGWPAYGDAVLRAGFYVGATAQTWFDVNGANLLVVGDHYATKISGSLTRRQLYEVAESLEQR